LLVLASLSTRHYLIIFSSSTLQDLLQAVTIKDTKTGETKDLPVNGLFYAIGHDPATGLVRDQLECDEDGYIKTGTRALRTLFIIIIIN
jgi:thioredoxin reductase